MTVSTDQRKTGITPPDNSGKRAWRYAVPRQPQRRNLLVSNPTTGNGTTRGGAGFGANTRLIPSVLLNEALSPPADRALSGHPINYASAGSFAEGGGSFPNFLFASPRNVTTTGTSTYGQRGFSVHQMFNGSEFGILVGGNGGKFTLKINDEYLSTLSVSSVAVAAGGAGYAVDDILTLSNGVSLAVASVSAGVITSAAIINPGSVSAEPANPVSASGGSGAGSTFNLTWRSDVAYTSIPNDGQPRYYRFDLGVRDIYRVDLRFYNTLFGGFVINGNDSITTAPVRGPRVICVGDSFTDGTGAHSLTLNHWVALLADYMGWDDVWPSGVGGTGYVSNNGGSNCSFAERVAHDVLQYNPDIVITLGGFNDKNSSPSTFQAAAGAYYSALRQGLPDALLVASTNNNMGVNGASTSANYLDIMSRLKSVVQGVNGLWLDLQEMPLAGTAPATASLRTAAITANLPGSTVVQASGPFPIGATVQIENERMQVIGCAGGPSTFNLTFDGTWRDAHAVDSVFTQVGSSLWTGAGAQTSPRSYGSCTRFVSNDKTHPSNEGHQAIGQAIATMLLDAINAGA